MHSSDGNFVVIEREEFHPLEEVVEEPVVAVTAETKPPERVYSQFMYFDDVNEKCIVSGDAGTNAVRLTQPKFVLGVSLVTLCACVVYALKPKR